MLKYLIIGAGGTGGTLGAYLARAGKDVTFIARGDHLRAMQDHGLTIIRPGDEFRIDPVKASEAGAYHDKADVIYRVPELAEQYQAELPIYQKIAASLREQLGKV